MENTSLVSPRKADHFQFSNYQINSASTGARGTTWPNLAQVCDVLSEEPLIGKNAFANTERFRIIFKHIIIFVHNPNTNAEISI
jgi:hypothetical protein